jgi:hypothetical protein
MAHGPTTESREVFAPDGSIHRAQAAVPRYPRATGRVTANVVTIQRTGPSDQRFDLVFVGDGYTAGQLGLYHQHVLQRWEQLTGVEPFRSLKDRFNVWQVDVVSNESGSDNDPARGDRRDTALDSQFWCGGLDRLLCVDDQKAQQYAGLAPGDDQTLAVVNSATYGGSGGSVAVSSGGNSRAGEIVAHELGHSIGGLADEYDTGESGPYTGAEPREPNASKQRGTKWASYLGKPTPDGGVIGAYEGALYHKTGVFRPSQNSIMRTLGHPYNAVGLDIMRAAILRRAS